MQTANCHLHFLFPNQIMPTANLLFALLVSLQVGSTLGWITTAASAAPSVHNRRTQAQRYVTAAAACWQDESTILQGIDEDFAQRQWCLPSIVERALIHGDAWVDPHQLLQALDMLTTARNQAIEALEASNNVLNAPRVF